jgi:type IV pilus assembly protein PilV
VRLVTSRRVNARGFTLIEILVTIVILMVGLLGVIAMQSRAANVEFESYQRAQALALVREMQARIMESRSLVAEYTADSLSSTDGSVYVGSGAAGDAGRVDCSGAGNVARANVCAWAQSLEGAAAVEAGRSVGAMIGARGCLIRVQPPQDNALADLYVVVVWQGLTAGVEPPVDSPAGAEGCASGAALGSGLRRGVSLRVLVPNLTKTS